MPTRKKEAEPGAAAAAFEPDTLYRVEVSEVIRAGGLIIRPKGGGTLRGAIAQEFADKITSFEAVAE